MLSRHQALHSSDQPVFTGMTWLILTMIPDEVSRSFRHIKTGHAQGHSCQNRTSPATSGARPTYLAFDGGQVRPTGPLQQVWAIRTQEPEATSCKPLTLVMQGDRAALVKMYLGKLRCNKSISQGLVKTAISSCSLFSVVRGYSGLFCMPTPRKRDR